MSRCTFAGGNGNALGLDWIDLELVSSSAPTIMNDDVIMDVRNNNTTKSASPLEQRIWINMWFMYIKIGH
jgi:hypothetical protein